MSVNIEFALLDHIGVQTDLIDIGFWISLITSPKFNRIYFWFVLCLLPDLCRWWLQEKCPVIVPTKIRNRRLFMLNIFFDATDKCSSKKSF